MMDKAIRMRMVFYTGHFTGRPYDDSLFDWFLHEDRPIKTAKSAK